MAAIQKLEEAEAEIAKIGFRRPRRSFGMTTQSLHDSSTS
jgi:hypothetical protein